MPYTWPSEALKAQAVAARSYALANVVKGKALRPLFRRSQPGVPRGRGREAADDRGGALDRRPGRPLLRASSRRPSTSRPRAARPPAPPMCSGPRSPTSSRVLTRGTRRRRTTRGAPSCSALARSRQSSGSTIASSTRSAFRRRPAGCAHSHSRRRRARRACRRACFGAASGSARRGSPSASFASISPVRPSSSGRRSG